MSTIAGTPHPQRPDRIAPILLPLQCEYYALEGLGRLLSVVKLVRQRLNPLFEIEGVLLTMYDGRTLLARRVADEARRYFGTQVFKTVIPRNVKLERSTESRQADHLLRHRL